MPFLQPLLRYSTPPSGDAMCAAAKAFEKIKVQGRCDKFFVCHIVLFLFKGKGIDRKNWEMVLQYEGI